MKFYKLIFSIIVGLLATSCNLEEEPPFLANENVFGSLKNSQSALDGVYNSFTDHAYFRNFYHYTTNGSSGFFVSGKGNSSTSADNENLCSLKPLNSSVHIEKHWTAVYQSIGRANDIINSIDAVETPVLEDEIGMNDVLGQAYFIRAYDYFNLVRLWGDIPLRLVPTTTETVHLAKSPAKDVYTQIISDAQQAAALMYGVAEQRIGYPAKFAADMLLAKVYMTLATAPVELQDAGTDYWTLAYNEAINVYNQYSLVSNYDDLFTDPSSGFTAVGNSAESIFEIQFNEVQDSDFVKLFTGTKATKGTTFGRLKINPEVYDLHLAEYPTDPRIASTFKGSYPKFKNGQANGTQASYPENTSRNSFKISFPYLYKYWEKNSNNTTTANNQNFIVYRYADLILMLAEISNELQNGEQMGYVTEVLDRVSVTPHADYSVGQASFRNAIMREYRFELLGEGQDWFNNRRRGFDFFNTNVIIPHNTAATFKASVDVTLHNVEADVMHLPFPANEINANQDINN